MRYIGSDASVVLIPSTAVREGHRVFVSGEFRRVAYIDYMVSELVIRWVRLTLDEIGSDYQHLIGVHDHVLISIYPNEESHDEQDPYRTQ